MSDHLDPMTSDLSQILLHKARLEARAGDWLRCEDLATRGIFRAPEPTCLLALHLVRAQARFETGDYSGASADLDRADSLRAVFPEPAAAAEVRELRLRLQAHLVPEYALA